METEGALSVDLWTYEREQWAAGYETVCGVDEAGAGPLAGPVYAAAVILPRELEIPGLDDSKKLTEKKREALYGLITAQAAAYSVARVEAEEIDEMDILNAGCWL
jgi:ribonuclease HII